MHRYPPLHAPANVSRLIPFPFIQFRTLLHKWNISTSFSSITSALLPMQWGAGLPLFCPLHSALPFNPISTFFVFNNSNSGSLQLLHFLIITTVGWGCAYPLAMDARQRWRQTQEGSLSASANAALAASNGGTSNSTGKWGLGRK